MAGVPIYTSSPGDSSIGMNIAYHALINGSRFMIDPNRDVNEVCAIVLAGEKNGCVILGGGSPKNFYLQGQPTLWEVYGIPKVALTFSSRSPPTRSSGAGSLARRRQRPSVGAGEPRCLAGPQSWRIVIRRLRFPCFANMPLAPSMPGANGRRLCTARGELLSELERQAREAAGAEGRSAGTPGRKLDIHPD